MHFYRAVFGLVGKMVNAIEGKEALVFVGMTRTRKIRSTVAFLFCALWCAQEVRAEVVRLESRAFKSGSGLITFSSPRRDTPNPSYRPENYGGGPGAPVVSTGGWFQGQGLSRSPNKDCPGAARSACVVGKPTGELRIDPSSPKAFPTRDGSFKSSPTLSGTPRFNGPIALHFDKDQVGVGFEAGFFNSRRSTGIAAFARDGTRLGVVVNRDEGIEFLGLVTADGRPRIAGVSLVLVGKEPAGFNIDNLRFAQAEQLDLPEQVKDALTQAENKCCH